MFASQCVGNLATRDRPMTTRYIIRHGAMRFLGDFEPAEGGAYLRNQQVIVRSDRGLETGEVLCPANERAVQLIAEPTHGQIVRVMTEKDHAEMDRIRQAELTEFHSCNEFIASRSLQMDLVDVEHLFGG